MSPFASRTPGRNWRSTEGWASGKWPEGQTRWGTFHYVQDPKGGAIVEFISRIPRQ
jgi:hypothetical protein